MLIDQLRVDLMSRFRYLLNPSVANLVLSSSQTMSDVNIMDTFEPEEEQIGIDHLVKMHGHLINLGISLLSVQPQALQFERVFFIAGMMVNKHPSADEDALRRRQSARCSGLPTIETKTSVKREHLVYGTAGILALYLIVGSAAALVCNLIGLAIRRMPSPARLLLECSDECAASLLGDESFLLAVLGLAADSCALKMYARVVDPAVTKLDALLAKYNVADECSSREMITS
uniref:Uncharacterized protein n=1 Tax=Ditylenchus dipsaci TaxID=166011 RepID=A0A915E679_9BILA